MIKSQQFIAAYKECLVQMNHGIIQQSKSILSHRANDITNTASAIKVFYRNYLKGERTKLEHYKKLIAVQSPASILKKGFAIVKQHGSILTNAASIEKGSAIKILLSDAQLNATVTQKTILDGKEPDL